MTAAPLAPDHQIDGLPVRRMLANLTSLHELVLVFDSSERVVWVSDALAGLFGSSHATIGCTISDLIDASSTLDDLRSDLASTAATGAARLTLRTSDPLEVDVSAFRPGGDEIFIAVLRPVSAPRMPTPDVGFLLSVLDSAPGAVISTDLGGFVTYANSLAAELLEIQGDELVGLPMAALLPRATGLDEILCDVRIGQVKGHDIEIRREGGELRWLSVSASRLFESDGEPTGCAVFLRDVTDRRRIEAALERKNDELENYVLNVSHDLRSPLVSVRGFARLLRQDYESLLDDSGHHFLDRIEQAGQTMETLIEDLLELSRIGRSDEPRGLIDPRAVLQQIASELKTELDARKIELVVPQQPPMLNCNRTRLYQLFANLISNAVVHMGPCPHPRIEVTIREARECWEIVVEDNGMGIAEEHHERIFEVFTTLGPRPDGRKSTGIGLAIVRKIAATHGGDAWVRSHPDRGAAFHATLRRELKSIR